MLKVDQFYFIAKICTLAQMQHNMDAMLCLCEGKVKTFFLTFVTKINETQQLFLQYNTYMSVR